MGKIRESNENNTSVLEKSMEDMLSLCPSGKSIETIVDMLKANYQIRDDAFYSLLDEIVAIHQKEKDDLEEKHKKFLEVMKEEMSLRYLEEDIWAKHKIMFATRIYKAIHNII